MFKKDLKKIEKICMFPNCNEVFEAYPQTKYCLEHRDTKYRKFLPQKRKMHYANDNFKYQHGFEEVTPIQRKCSIDDCTTMYEIIVYPGQYTYCNFCEKHRNPYKRSNRSGD